MTEFNLVSHLIRQFAFSLRTFGPGPRTLGNLDHIRKELAEIEKDPDDLKEWVDVMLLAFDGAMRRGHLPKAIVAQIEATQTRNEGRSWPDWRTMSPDRAIEHDRSDEQVSTTIFATIETNPALMALLAKARSYRMTSEERELQRKSWVIGEMMLENTALTHAEAEELYFKAVQP